MSLYYDIKSSDSLQTLIEKVNAIITVNTESFNFIESRKGQKIIKSFHKIIHTDHTRNPNEIANIDEDIFDVGSYQITEDADDAIQAWRHQGKPLTRESNVFEEFMKPSFRIL